jgi:hypothetical protein
MRIQVLPSKSPLLERFIVYGSAADKSVLEFSLVAAARTGRDFLFNLPQAWLDRSR